MTTTERRGWLIVWIVAACVVLNIGSSILRKPIPDASWILNVVVPAAIAVGLTQRRRWARFLFVAGCVCLSGTFILMLLMHAESTGDVLLGGFAAMVLMIAGSVIWASKSVEAFFQLKSS